MTRVNDRLKSLAVRSFARRTSQCASALAMPRALVVLLCCPLLPSAHLASHPDKSPDSNQEVAL